MRPPLNAGENLPQALDRDDPGKASMRPPLNAGENRVAGEDLDDRPAGFNEAPAERGGKRQDQAGRHTWEALLQ